MDMQLQMAKRSPGADIPLPAVVHWRTGHFAALLKKEGDRVLMKDPIFEQEFWMNQAALEDESAVDIFWSARGNLPAGWQAVSMDEAQKVWGKGSSTQGSMNFQRIIDPKVKPCPEVAGMAQYNFNATLASLTVFGYSRRLSTTSRTGYSLCRDL